MRTFRHFSAATIFAVCVFSLGCTRNGDTSQMTISIPMKHAHIASNACDSNPPPIQTVIVNVQVAGQPTQAAQMDYKAGRPFDFSFPTVQNGTALVQVLGVFGSDGGAMQLKYADQTVSVNGQTTASIDLTSTGTLGFTIKKQSYLPGRIALADGSYPSGTLLAKFSPPGNKPKMIVDQKTIVAGFFNIFAVSFGSAVADANQPLFDYFWVESPTPTIPLFTGLNPDLNSTACAGDETSTTGSCPFQPFSDRIKIHKAASYSRSGKSDNPTLQTNSEVEYVLGYFGTLGGSSNKVCFANDVYEAIPRLFSAAADTVGVCSLWQTPLDVDLTTGPISPVAVSTSKVEYMGGGMSSHSNTLYTLNDVNCSGTMVDSGSAMILNHTLLGNNDENFGGFNPPWRMVQPFATNSNQYVAVSINRALTTFSAPSVTNTMTINSAGTPLINSTVSSPVTSQGTIITGVAGSSGNWTVTLNQNVTTTGSGNAELSPSLLINWKLIGLLSSSISSGSTSIGSFVLSSVSSSFPPIVGSFVDSGIFPPGSQLLKVTSLAPANPNHYDLTFSQPATATSGSTILFPFSGMEVWAKYTLNLNATVSSGNFTLSNISPPILDNSMVGMPLFGSGIPAGAIISSITLPNTITMNVRANGSAASTSITVGSTNSGGNHDDCNSLSSNGGFQTVTTLTPSAAPTYNFSGSTAPFLPPPGPNINYQFAICAARGTGATKTYLGSYIMGQQTFAGETNDWPFGWASAAKIDPAPGAGSSNEPGLKIMSLRVTSTSAGNIGVTRFGLEATPTVDVVPGTEVMLRVLGMGLQPGCGPGVSIGDYTFARVLDVTSSVVSIPSGTYADRLLGLTNLTNTPLAGSNFCYVQLTYVPHFRNLTLNSGYTTQTASSGFNFQALQPSNTSIAVFRVSGKLSINGNMSVGGAGYTGGTYPSNMTGAGSGGPTGLSGTLTGGKMPGTQADGAGGGGGYGNGGGGSTPSNAAGGSGNSFGNQWIVNAGSGGANSGGPSANGGNGGGVIYIAANQLLNNLGTLIIAADGSVSATNGGGGGGGSINLMVNSLTGAPSTTMALSAKGGNSAGNGGGGGGGFVNFISCSSDSNISVSAPIVSAGTNSGGTGSSAGIGSANADVSNASRTSGVARWCQ
jgi:hypothetical protein